VELDQPFPKNVTVDEIKLPKADIYVVALSGGKDSTAVAVLTAKQGLAAQYVFCDTKAEYPEVYEYLDKIERTLGIEITRIESEGFEAILKRKNYMFPSPRRRWCTQLLKIKPMQKWFQQFGGATICTLVGNRTDERRVGRLRSIGSAGELRAFPLMQLGYGKDEVEALLIKSKLGIPIYYQYKPRSGCWCCPFQSVMSWRRLLRYHPELFAKAEEWQAEIDNWVKIGKKRTVFKLPSTRKITLAQIREIETSQMPMNFELAALGGTDTLDK
jgi:3'-phosphoadenosine 5'-phosphosulfate sulfotransferase (PAPS reductase)/FAD synthetase